MGLLLLSIMISGCGPDQNMKKMYTDNNMIAQEWDSHSYQTYEFVQIKNGYDLMYGGFYGSDTIVYLEPNKEAEVTFQYNSTVDSGSFKAVLIDPKMDIHNVFTGTAKGVKTFKLEKGRYLFKVVGKEAKGETSISIINKQNVKLISDV